MFNVDKKGMFQKCYSGVFVISWRIFLTSLTESDFCKSSGLYINSSEGVCDAVCI